jgi:hypothetical protein
MRALLRPQFACLSLGYSAAFLTLAGIAGAGLLLFWLAMPETRDAAAADLKSRDPYTGEAHACRAPSQPQSTDMLAARVHLGIRWEGEGARGGPGPFGRP